MPEDTLANVLTQLQRVLNELYDTGRTTLTSAEVETLTRQVAYMQWDEDRRIKGWKKPPRMVRWDCDYCNFDDHEEMAQE